MQNFNLIPSSFGLCFNSGKSTLGISVYQLDSFKFSTITINDDSSTSRLEIDASSYLMGLSFAYSISDNLSLGISCFYHYYIGEMSKVSRFSGNIKIVQNQTTSGGIIPVAGLKLNIAPIKIGLSYSYETINLNGKNKYTYYSTSGSAGQGEVKGDVRLPNRITLGIALVEKNNYIISLDVIYYFSMKYSAPNEMMHNDMADWDHRENSHFNISLGGELNLSETFALRMGLYTNTSGADTQDKNERVNLYGGTLGMGYKAGTVTTNTGLNVMYGKTGILSDSGGEGIEWERLSISLIIGGSTSFN